MSLCILSIYAIPAPRGEVVDHAKSGDLVVTAVAEHFGGHATALDERRTDGHVLAFTDEHDAVEGDRSARLCVKFLEPQEIGVQLTEGWMMDPEASVSALVFHHPDARYFAV